MSGVPTAVLRGATSAVLLGCLAALSDVVDTLLGLWYYQRMKTNQDWLLVEPDGTAAWVEMSGNNLADMRTLIGCRTVDVVGSAHGFDVWCDDEGYIAEKPVNMLSASLVGQPVAGTVLIAACTSGGKTVPVDPGMVPSMMILGPTFTHAEVATARESGSWWLSGKGLVNQ